MNRSLGTVTESNTNAQSVISGTLSSGSLAGLNVIGVAFAGQRTGNVGEVLQGIFGTLQVNANGTYTYILDNEDRDTDLLSSGEVAHERFVVTYRLGGVTQTVAIDVTINGANEPGQVFTDYSQGIFVNGDYLIEEGTYIRFRSEFGFTEGFNYDPFTGPLFENFGSISFTSDGSSYQGYAAGPNSPPAFLYNYGRITAESDSSISGDITAILNFGENHGVASAIHTAPYQAGSLAGRAVGVQGVTVNTGLIEAISNTDAYGVWMLGGGEINNSGLIYVEGGAGYPNGVFADPLGIIGFRSSGGGSVVNSGTVHVVSNYSGVESVGFRFFYGASNVYNPITFDNSGTIVADRAIIADGHFRSSVYLTNAGHIEGTLELDDGVNLIHNTATGYWRGDFTLGVVADQVRNAGEIVGSINMGAGYDHYVGVGSSSVSGTVFGDAGNDLFEGGDGIDRFSGDSGRDWLVGGLGADRLTGGTGADTFFYRSAMESTSSQRDMITDFQTGVDVIDISNIGASSFTLTVSGANTILRAVTSDGTLEVLVNGAVANSDVVTAPRSSSQTGGGGADILYAGWGAASLFGRAGNDALFGSFGDDFLNGGPGADVLNGGFGNDTYVIDDPNDLIVETADGGLDEVQTTISILMPTNVEIGRITGTGDLSIGGNNSDNILYGNDGNNSLVGGGGTNFLIGGLGADNISMGFGTDTAVYLSAADSTAAAPDLLRRVDSSEDRIDLTALDVISFHFGETVSYRLSSGASLFTIQAVAVTIATSDGDMVIHVSGDAPAMELFLWSRPEGIGATWFGRDVADDFSGTADADTIYGLGGADLLYGLAGDDTLIGGLGDDRLFGGLGSDTAVYSGNFADYTITDLGDGRFTIAGAEGTDTLTAMEYAQFADFRLDLLNPAPPPIEGTPGVDRLEGTSAGDVIFGFADDDVLLGRGGDDVLDGGLGADTMYGGVGDDTYYLDSLSDRAIEGVGGGFDRAYFNFNFVVSPGDWSNFESFALYGAGSRLAGDGQANELVANDDLVSTLYGNGGADTLIGGAQRDLLYGGAGDDM
ncbi:M10 family metallopeptidase C-terminal domain-containing protein, partial [Aurantiacibacter sp. D1-12]|uniref:M10 family metallopeptidase C-terminal domain-containing protein n=1 Tax=Aurantiacibacter sp. D1-12 TaxID=2993658 RepID=UPI00237CEBF8